MSSEPEPPAKPARSALTMRDMLVALAVLGGIVLLLAGITGSCSFSPGRPTVDDSRLPTVDAPAELRQTASFLDFPVVVPSVPPGWQANSVDQDRAGDRRVVRVGYLTADDRYLRLVQSDADEAALLVTETGPTAVPGTGVREVAGLRWVVYERDGEEPIWIAERADPTTATRLLITGSGSEEDFLALAGAVAAGVPA
jgi:hypothetical protein